MAFTDLNRFSQQPVKGQVDLMINPTIFNVELDPSYTGTLLPGQLVKLANVAGGVMKVTPSTAITDKHFGVICYNVKDPSFRAGAADANGLAAVPFFEVASTASVIYMEASAAIARGADVSYAGSGTAGTGGSAGNVIKTAVTTEKIVGVALDAATAAGQLVRVMLAGPNAPLVP